MKQNVRRLAWRVLGPQPQSIANGKRTRVDTVQGRYDVVDLAMHNIKICSRGESSGRIIHGDSLLGDYLEFGVYKGSVFYHACETGYSLFDSKRFFAFDSFCGLPKITGADQEGEFDKGMFSCSKKNFLNEGKSRNIDLSRIVVEEGWFDKTLTKHTAETHKLKRVSIAYIDADLYQSTVPVLRFISNLITQGSILLFDDWYNFRNSPEHGVQRAVNEWLAEETHVSLTKWHSFSHHGQAFIVNSTKT